MDAGLAITDCPGRCLSSYITTEVCQGGCSSHFEVAKVHALCTLIEVIITVDARFTMKY